MSTPRTGIAPVRSPLSGVRDGLNRALFDLHTPLGRRVNAGIMTLVIVSVALAMLATLDGLPAALRAGIERFELAVTALFALEYMLRLFAARRPAAYAFSFYGLVDLATWLPLLIGQGNVALRLLRIVRLLKLMRYMGALRLFLASMRDASELVLVAVGAIAVIAVIAGNLIHAVEPQTFGNAFIGFWWALVTMTTVGYGDLVPATGAGMAVAAVLMLTGITMFAVLTGTVSVKVASLLHAESRCGHCRQRIRARYAYCPHCGRATAPAPARD